MGKSIVFQQQSLSVCVCVLVCVSSFSHDLISIHYDHFS